MSAIDHLIDRFRRPLAICASGIALCAIMACAETGPRQEPVPYQLSMQWNDVMTVKVLDTWDLVKHHAKTAPQATHVVEVEILEGMPDYVGKTFTLQYDEWATGAPPPSTGSIVVMTASSWVRPNPTSHGAPHPNWDK